MQEGFFGEHKNLLNHPGNGLGQRVGGCVSVDTFLEHLKEEDY